MTIRGFTTRIFKKSKKNYISTQYTQNSAKQN